MIIITIVLNKKRRFFYMRTYHTITFNFNLFLLLIYLIDVILSINIICELCTIGNFTSYLQNEECRIQVCK